MNTIIINGIKLGVELLPVQSDGENSWRNGVVILPDGTRVDCGGGWIETEESANQKNEAAGIAGGLRQGVSYPNETCEGDYYSYSYGEDESGWEEIVMPVLYGAGWKAREDADDEAREVHLSIQGLLMAILAKEGAE